jgi:hypothetical protein
MNELIDQQLDFLRNQSLITYARLEFKEGLIDFHLVDGEWELEPIEKGLED